MSAALAKLIEIARRFPMTDAEREEQIIRFSYGSAKIENDDVTEQMVREAAARIRLEEAETHE